jgi:hypothetical protein
MKRYIQYKYKGELETIDEMEIKTKEDRQEFKRLLSEYRLAYNFDCIIYASRKPCKHWKL